MPLKQQKKGGGGDRFSESFYYDIIGTFSGAIEAQFNCPHQINIKKILDIDFIHIIVQAMYSISVITSDIRIN